jgi:uncharacterized CHY-type Zn-finger protein
MLPTHKQLLQNENAADDDKKRPAKKQRKRVEDELLDKPALKMVPKRFRAADDDEQFRVAQIHNARMMKQGPMLKTVWFTESNMGRLPGDAFIRVKKKAGVLACCRLARACKFLSDATLDNETWLYLWSQRNRMVTCIHMLAPAKAIGAPVDDDNKGAVAVWYDKKPKTNVKVAFATLHTTSDPLHMASCKKKQAPLTCKRRLSPTTFCDTDKKSPAERRCAIAGCGVVRCGPCCRKFKELVMCEFCKAAFSPLHREIAPGIIGNCERLGSAAAERPKVVASTFARIAGPSSGPNTSSVRRREGRYSI